MLNAIGQELREEFQASEEVCANVIGLFQLMANKQRFRIVCILSRGEFCVSEIAEIMGVDKVSNISQQLKVLRLAGVVACRRADKRMVYSMADNRMRGVIGYLKQQFT